MRNPIGKADVERLKSERRERAAVAREEYRSLRDAGELKRVRAPDVIIGEPEVERLEGSGEVRYTGRFIEGASGVSMETTLKEDEFGWWDDNGFHKGDSDADRFPGITI